MSSTPFDVVVACDEKNGIGKDGDLPWRLPPDLRHLVELTKTAPEGKRNSVVMGRTTWESIPTSWRPLVGRQNVVLSRQTALALPDGVHLAGALDAGLDIAGGDIDRIFVLGGGVVYAEAVEHPRCRWIYLTRVLAEFDCDAFFPAIDKTYERVEVLDEGAHEGLGFRIERWARPS